jgi:hypothetical protein
MPCTARYCVELRAPDPVREAANEAALKTMDSLARFLVASTVQTPALDLIDQALIDRVDTPDCRLIVTLSLPEGEIHPDRRTSTCGASHQQLAP